MHPCRFFFFFLLVTALSPLISCAPPPAKTALTAPPTPMLPDSVRELTPDEAQAMIATVPGLLIMDVRSEGEAKTEGKLAGAELHDYLHGDEMFKGLEKLDHEKRCLIYCAIGGRAKLTAARMSAMGFSHLSLVKGGINAWIAAGKPVQR